MIPVSFPLNEVQVSLLRLTEKISEQDMQILKRMIIAFKAQRLAELADKVWDEKGWTEETMQTFLNTHLRTPYLLGQQQGEK